MQLLDLAPGEFGVKVAGTYVIDNDERAVLAGPFYRTADALAWIEQKQPEHSAGGDGQCDVRSALPADSRPRH